MKRFTTIAFLLTSFGCTLLSTTNHVWQHYTVGDGLVTNEVRQVVELPNGQILVNCEGAFCLFDGQTFREISCDLNRAYRLGHFGGYAHLWAGDSLLWLRDFYHLYLFDTRTRTFRYDVKEWLASEQVRNLLDGEGTYEQPDELWQQLADSLGAAAKVAHTMVDRQGGQWIGTRGNGLFYVRPSRLQAISIGRNDSLLCAVRYMHDSHGQVWQCTKDGLYCRPKSDILCSESKAMHYTQNNVAGFVHNRMSFITELPDGRMLLCNNGNYLGYFTPESRTFDVLNRKLPQINTNYRWIVGACPLTEEDVLVYSQNGAFMLNIKHDSICEFTPANEIARWTEKYNCALQDSKGRLWLGTQNGLFLIENENVKIKTPVRIKNLANNCIRSLVEDKDGNIWVGSSSGISRIGADEPYPILNLGPADGVPQVSMNERAAKLLDDGHLVFVQHTMGLIIFRPEWFAADTTPYPVRLVGFEVNGQALPSSSYSQFHHTQNYLTFRFSALNYAAPEHTIYRYRLVGLDRNWLYDACGTGIATASYNALQPGDYVLEAQAAVDGGKWGERLQVTFTILPPWWLTWWMKTIYGLVILWGLAYLINFYLKRKRAHLEAETEERVNRLFELREQARHQFVENVRVDVSKIGVNSEEEALVRQLLKAIENNLDNTEYSVEQLARDVALGRTNLYKRMQTMLGITPNDFIRSIRLKRAATLLSDTNLSIVEISERIGFNTPRYFSSSFKAMFGITPSEYRAGEKSR
ncbi:MAG: helix-turn-helix domain-containing protein [Bacteroidaceae bacterium]